MSRALVAFGCAGVLAGMLGACGGEASDANATPAVGAVAGGNAGDEHREEGVPASGTIDDDGDAGSGADAAVAGAPKAVAITPGTTKDAELEKTLSVGTSANGAERKVVLRLAPSDLPSLAVGDRLKVLAEVQVTTRCDVGQVAPGCNYNPTISAQLVLTGKADDTDAAGAESKALSDVVTQSCTLAEHHCMFVFSGDAAAKTLQGDLALPCVANDTCNVNLVMWAWSPSARAGGVDKVILGGNEGDYLMNGLVDPGKARLMAVRERNISTGDREVRQSTGSGTVTMPLNASSVLLYSHPLEVGGGVPKKGERYVVEAKIVTKVSGRARFSTQLFLTENPKAVDGQKIAEITPSAISEHNGINCTSGTSPCTTRKVAVFEVSGTPTKPLYVNVFAKSEVPGGGAATVTVDKKDGFIETTTYAAGLAE